MSDNEDLLGDDLGDQSLADYNLGNEEEEQLLADDYDTGPQNVPTSLGPRYEPEIAPEYTTHIEYTQPIPYQPVVETECVVPNITGEVPNPRPDLPHCTYAPYDPVYEPERAVPPAIPAAPIESPQIVPSDLNSVIANGDLGARERFISERPPGTQRLPQIRDIPDSLDKVVVPRGRGRGWVPRHRHRVLHRANYNPRMSFQSPQMHIRNDLPPMRPEMRSEMRPDMPLEMLPPVGPEISPDRPIVPELMQFRPQFPRFQFRPNVDERPPFAANLRPNFEPRHMFPYPRPYRYPPPREIGPNPDIRQVTIRQPLPVVPDKPKEPEVRMLPVQLPPNLPPGGLAGKKVLINPHFKGTFQPPVEGLPAYIPTRISKSPPPIGPPPLEAKFGPIKDIDDAAERFIAEQRNALARAASRKFTRRSPLRFIENTTIEIENDLASTAVRRRSEDDDLLRRQEEFINANRAGLRRRMRSPSPVRRSPSPRPSPERRTRVEPHRHNYDEESEYKRRLREQESLRERVLRAKEVRRRKNAVALHNKIQEREREEQMEKEKEKEPPKVERPEVVKPEPVVDKPSSTETEPKPDTTRISPEKPEKPQKVEKPVKMEKVRERSPLRKEESVEVNSTCESLTPPREVALTPPLPDDDDDLDLILGDIDGILSDDDDTGRFKQKPVKPEPAKTTTTKPSVDLRSKLPPKSSSNSDAKKSQRQKIVFNDNEERKGKEKSPLRKAVVSSTKNDDNEIAEKKQMLNKSDSAPKNRQRIVFDKEEKQKEEADRKFANRRVIIQRRVTQKEKRTETDPTQPTLGIFSRAVRTAVRGVDDPRVELAEDDDDDPPTRVARPPTSSVASVMNLPPGITDTRLKTLAGNDVQNLILDKEDRSAKITFKTPAAAENFKRKFNNKMVAASRLTVTLR